MQCWRLTLHKVQINVKLVIYAKGLALKIVQKTWSRLLEYPAMTLCLWPWDWTPRPCLKSQGQNCGKWCKFSTLAVIKLNQFVFIAQKVDYYTIIRITEYLKHCVIWFYINLWLPCWPWSCIISDLGLDTGGHVNIRQKSSLINQETQKKVNGMESSSIRPLN